MIAWILNPSGVEPGEIHVAIETPHGPIVEALLERGFNVYSINPTTVSVTASRSPGRRMIVLMPMCLLTASGQTCGCSVNLQLPGQEHPLAEELLQTIVPRAPLN
jgi:hypothetical protein